MGNLKANALANPDEARNPPPTSTSDFADRDSQLEKYIRKKWETGAFRARQTLSASSSSSTNRLDPVGYARTKTSPLPELPPPSPEVAAAPARSPVFGGTGRLKDPSVRLVAKQHVQSNWDDFSSFAESAAGARERERERDGVARQDRPVLSYKSSTPRSTTPSAPAPASAAAPAPVVRPAPAPAHAPATQSHPTLIDTSVPSGPLGPPPIVAALSAWPQPPGWPGQAYMGPSNGSLVPQAFATQPVQLSPGNPFLQYQTTGLQQAPSPFMPQGAAYGMQPPPLGTNGMYPAQLQPQLTAFPAQPFQQQGMAYQPASPFQQAYPSSPFGQPNAGQQQPLMQQGYAQPYGQGQQTMPQGWGMR